MSRNSKPTYTILCAARKGEEMGISLLAMVDKAKNSDLHWTSDNPELVVKFYSQGAAERTCARLEHNHPEVVDYWEAIDVIRAQAQKVKDFRIQKNLAEINPTGETTW